MILRKTKYQVLEITADANGCVLRCDDIDFGWEEHFTKVQAIRLVKYLSRTYVLGDNKNDR
jgi:hypothetical protein